jgi:hypothetical protein
MRCGRIGLREDDLDAANGNAALLCSRHSRAVTAPAHALASHIT